jgi:hypothetical protein
VETPSLREALSDAIRYWEPRRWLDNSVLAAVVLIFFGVQYPESRQGLMVDLALNVFLLAVLSHVA